MTLDEAIKYAENMAALSHKGSGNAECEQNHRQLAEWLRDYKRLLEQDPCENAISRQEVLDMMQMRMGGKELYKAVYDLPSVNPQEPKWIPVTNRLPKKDDLYLICFDNGEYELSYFYKDSFSYSGVIAWLPLPEPYKAESEEE